MTSSLFPTGLWNDKLARLRKANVNQEAMIGGKVCRIEEAEEPSEVLWEHVDATLCRRYEYDTLFSPVACLVFFMLRAKRGGFNFRRRRKHLAGLLIVFFTHATVEAGAPFFFFEESLLEELYPLPRRRFCEE